MSRKLTAVEVSHLRSLGPHTAVHARRILEEHPLLTISSSYRSAERNRRVGGVPDSFHLRRRAVDYVGPLLDLHRAAGTAWALRVGSTCTGPEEVLLEFSGTSRQHLHCAW